MWSLDRLFHSSNGDVPGSVCLRRALACSTSRSALPCDRTPDPGVDHATASGSVSVGPGTEVSAARSRCDLWLRVRRHDEGHGCRGSGNGTASALAKSIRRTDGVFHPARMSGPHHCVEREIVASDSAELFIQDALIAGQGRANQSSDSTASNGSGCGNSSSWRPASPLHARSCLIEAGFQTQA